MPSISAESRGDSTIIVDRVITGAAKIAARAGCSERTIRRAWKAGRLKGAFQVGGQTSPLKITNANLDAFVQGGEE